MAQFIHPSSIDEVLKKSQKLIEQSKESIECSRSLRALSQEQIISSAEAMSRSDTVSEKSTEKKCDWIGSGQETAH